jgi:hypothetical protein
MEKISLADSKIFQKLDRACGRPQQHSVVQILTDGYIVDNNNGTFIFHSAHYHAAVMVGLRAY